MAQQRRTLHLYSDTQHLRNLLAAPVIASDRKIVTLLGAKKLGRMSNMSALCSPSCICDEAGCANESDGRYRDKVRTPGLPC